MRRVLSLVMVLAASLCASLVEAAPDLQVERCAVRRDTCSLGGAGNGNGSADPGEMVGITVTLRNAGILPGSDDATNVTITTASGTPGVSITQGNSSFGTITAGGTASGSPSVDFNLALSVGCGSALTFNVSIMSDQGDFSGSCVVTVPATCTHCVNSPVLALEACDSRVDVCALGGPGTGNSSVDPGEDINMQLAVSNSGLMAATNVNATVTTTTPGITISQSMVSFGMIAPASVSRPMTTINYSVAETVACGTNIVFDVAITSDQGPLNETCAIMIPVSCNPCVNAALLRLTSCGTRSDSCAIGLGNNNGEPEPGENITMSLQATNQGLAQATNVMATVTSVTPGVTITMGTTNFGTIMSLGMANGMTPIAYTLAPTVGCGTDLVFDVAFTSDQGNFDESCTVTIPINCMSCAALSGQCGLTGDTCASGGPGNMNSNIDPGEDGLLQIRASNQLMVAANSAMATVTTLTPGVTITQPNTSFGTIPAMGAVPGTPDIGFRVASSVACGTDIVFTIQFTSDQGMSSSTCVQTIPSPCNVCAGAGCIVANLDLPTALRGVRVGPIARFQWTADPLTPPQYHLNVVTDKRYLTETNPSSPRLAPVGMGATKCSALSPLLTCDDTSADTRPVLFYRALSACDIGGADEGRVCPVTRPCP